MKIYIVSHYYDNGEFGEDYRAYEEHKLYSTYQLGLRSFYDSIENDYEGEFTLTEYELDTQERCPLEKSAWVNCESYFDKMLEEQQEDYEHACEECDYSPDPMDSYMAYWEWEDLCCPTTEEDIPEEEDKDWLEYFTTPGTNYREWEECERELKERKNALLLEEIATLLKEIKIV